MLGAEGLTKKGSRRNRSSPGGFGELLGCNAIGAGTIVTFKGNKPQRIFPFTAPLRKPRTECACHPVALVSSASEAPVGRCSRRRILAVLVPARRAGAFRLLRAGGMPPINLPRRRETRTRGLARSGFGVGSLAGASTGWSDFETIMVSFSFGGGLPQSSHSWLCCPRNECKTCRARNQPPANPRHHRAPRSH